MTTDEFFQELKSKCQEQKLSYAEIRDYLLNQIKKEKIHTYYITKGTTGSSKEEAKILLDLLMVKEPFIYGFFIKENQSKRFITYKMKDLDAIIEDTTENEIIIRFRFGSNSYSITETISSADKIRDFVINVRDIWKGFLGY